MAMLLGTVLLCGVMIHSSSNNCLPLCPSLSPRTQSSVIVHHSVRFHAAGASPQFTLLTSHDTIDFASAELPLICRLSSAAFLLPLCHCHTHGILHGW
eukprot:scaffold140333_cov117-Cyclotella_meneghiniana.AAC.3